MQPGYQQIVICQDSHKREKRLILSPFLTILCNEPVKGVSAAYFNRRSKDKGEDDFGLQVIARTARRAPLQRALDVSFVIYDTK
jgi:hypothetical protein